VTTMANMLTEYRGFHIDAHYYQAAKGLCRESW
jgi:hypothetical protein